MTAESFRVLLIVGGLFVLGFNIAVIWHAPLIVRAVRAWRLFIVGKSGLTVFVILALWANRDDREVGWRIPLATFSIGLTLVALAMLDHAYRRKTGDEPAAIVHLRKEP